VTGADPSPVRLWPSTVSVTAPGLPSRRLTACRSVQVSDVPRSMVPWKIVAPADVVSAQQGSLTAVTKITTSGEFGLAAAGGEVLFAGGCLRAA
jgi:hypothetical protein